MTHVGGSTSTGSMLNDQPLRDHVNVAATPASSACRPIRSTGARRTCRSAVRQRARPQSVGAHRSDAVVGDTIVEDARQHTLRFGGDYRDIRADSRTDPNARGSFVFTGLYSGVDFADFLLGMPQQATVQFGPGPISFRSRLRRPVRPGRLAATRQADGQRRSALRVLLAVFRGRRSPRDARRRARLHRRRAGGRPARSARSPARFPTRLSDPVRDGFAPRVGVAWRPKTGTVVRGGYGINYNSSVYQSIAQQLAGQPPFASPTPCSQSSSPLFRSRRRCSHVQPGNDAPNLRRRPGLRARLRADLESRRQRDLTRTVQLGVGYTGTKGSNLDILRAPNRGPTGLSIPGVQPFIWESSEAIRSCTR